MTDPVKFFKALNNFIADTIIIQNDKVQKSHLIIPLLKLCLIDSVNTQNQCADQKDGQKYAQYQTHILPLIGPEPGGSHSRKSQLFHTRTPLSAAICPSES